MLGLSLCQQQSIGAEHPPRLRQSPLQCPSVADTISLLLLHCSVHPTPDMTTTPLTPMTAVYVYSSQHCSMLQCLEYPMPIPRELPLYPQIGNKKMSLGVPTSHGNTSQITKVNVLPLTWHQCYCLHRPMGEKKVCVYKCIFL